MSIEGAWYDEPLSKVEQTSTAGAAVDEEKFDSVFARAQKLYDETLARRQKSSQKPSSDAAFMQTVLKSGTLNDRISALTLKIQEDQLYSLAEFTTLLKMAQKNNRREALLALNSLKDLFCNGFLPDRKLK